MLLLSMFREMMLLCKKIIGLRFGEINGNCRMNIHDLSAGYVKCQMATYVSRLYGCVLESGLGLLACH